MNPSTWLDGFNLFHHWPQTERLFRRESGVDIVRAVNSALGILSRRLGGKGRNCVVYLDGGLTPHDARVAGLLVRYAGPGGKADDVMEADLLAAGGGSRLQITAVTNDRELKARLRALGAACSGVGEFFTALEKREGRGRQDGKDGKTGRSGGKPQAARFPGQADAAAVMREKQRRLTPGEVRAWLTAFGEDAEGPQDGEG